MVETISREEASWLAGIIEGEGSLMFQQNSLSHGKKTLRSVISVTNTDAKLIQQVSVIWTKLGCKFYYSIKKTKNGYALTISCYGRVSTDKVINLIKPFLASKINQADLLLEFNCEMGKGKYQRFGVEHYHNLQLNYREKLRSLRVNSINPQRLQRAASQILVIN